MTWKARSRDAGRIAATPMSDNIPTPDRFEGRVPAVDPQHESFLLKTDAGVQMVNDESPDDLTSPRLGRVGWQRNEWHWKARCRQISHFLWKFAPPGARRSTSVSAIRGCRSK